MAFTSSITGNCPTELTVYYTNTGKRYFFNSEDGEELKIVAASLSDHDINYSVQRTQQLSEGEVADLSGTNEECLNKISDCIFSSPRLIWNTETCLTQASVLNIIEDNGYKKNVVIEGGLTKNIDDTSLDYSGYILIDENFDLSTDYGNDFSQKYGYQTIQELYYDMGRKTLAGQSLPFMCSYQTYYCCDVNGDTCQTPVTTNKQCGDQIFSQVGLTDVSQTFNLPSVGEGYVTVDWNFGTSGDRIMITHDGAQQYDSGNVPPYYQGAGSYTYYYDSTTNDPSITIDVEPKVFENSDWVVTVGCPTQIDYEVSDTIIVPPSSKKSSRAFILDIDEVNQFLRLNYVLSLDDNEAYFISMYHNNVRVASTDGYVTTSGSLLYTLNYTNGDDGYVVLLVQKNGNNTIKSGEVVLNTTSTIF